MASNDKTPDNLTALDRARKALPGFEGLNDVPVIRAIGAYRGIAQAERATLRARIAMLDELDDALENALKEAVTAKHGTHVPDMEEWDEYDLC